MKWQAAGEDCIMRSFITCSHHQILLGRSSRGGWDGRKCSSHVRYEKCVKNFGRKNLKGERENHVASLNVDWKDNIIMELRETVWEVLDRIYAPQDRDR